LNDPNIPNNTEVVKGRRVSEQDRVLPAHYEARDVERSKVHRGILIGPIVAGSGEMVQARRNVCN